MVSLYSCNHTTLSNPEPFIFFFFFVKIFQVYLDYEIMVCVCVIVIETGSLEVYHSVILKYAEKRLHFTYDSMRARAQLAVMDNNNNLGRPQAKTQVGRYDYTMNQQIPVGVS